MEMWLQQIVEINLLNFLSRPKLLKISNPQDQLTELKASFASNVITEGLHFPLKHNQLDWVFP